MSGRGKFISFEGIDRSGKSTQAARLAEALGEGSLLVREPGGTELSERVRAILKDPSIPLSGRAEALLFAAARADLVERAIEPSLAAGRIVIADRFVDSSLAYQGAARGLGVEAVARVNDWASGGLMPDLTLLFEIEPALAAARGREQNDRFEDEGTDLQAAVAAAYHDLAERNPERIVRIDGARSEDELAAEVLRVVGQRLNLVAK